MKPHQETQWNTSCRRLFFLQNFEPAFVKGKPETLYSSHNFQCVEETNTLGNGETRVSDSQQETNRNKYMHNTAHKQHTNTSSTRLRESLANLNIGTPQA